MISSLYECRVMHARFAPRRHHFLYRIFLFAIDLDELPQLSRSVTLFSANRRNVYSFRDEDFFPTGERLHNGRASSTTAISNRGCAPSVKERVIAYTAARGTDINGGRVMLLTLPRVFGYAFNPVSLYFCYDRHGAPAAAIAEVTNTFREVKHYFVGADADTASSGNFRVRVPKHFYVSPYSDVDVAFDFALQCPASRLSIQIDDYIGAQRSLTSTVTGARRELTSARLAWFTLKYPLITLRVITLIHWHALLLWVKRVPWFRKSARRADQRELYRPHHSLQASDAT